MIHAPSSTKNKRGPEMSRTKKGNQWYFGIKARIGVDGNSGLALTVVGTMAKEADITQLEKLLHDGEEVFWATRGTTRRMVRSARRRQKVGRA